VRILPPPSSTLFPYTTLFRSIRGDNALGNPGAPWKRETVLRWESRETTQAFRASTDRCQVDTLWRLDSDDPPAGAGHHKSHVRRSEEHTSELQSRENLVCRLL